MTFTRKIRKWAMSLQVCRGAALGVFLVTSTGFTACSPSPESPADSASPSGDDTTTGVPDPSASDESGALPGEVGIPEACQAFCNTLTRCFPDDESHETCTTLCLDDAMDSVEGAPDPEDCSAAVVDFWYCQAAMKCEDVGGKSCAALDHKMDALCYGSEEPEVKELPGLRLLDACNAACDRVAECESKIEAAEQDSCILSCMSVAQGKLVTDPIQCILTAVAWAKCRAALECVDVLAGTGCEEEKQAIECEEEKEQHESLSEVSILRSSHDRIRRTLGM